LVGEIEIATSLHSAMTGGWIPTFVGMTEEGTGMTEEKSFLKYFLQLGEKWSKIDL